MTPSSTYVERCQRWHLKDGRIEIKGPYNEDLRVAIRAIKGRSWDGMYKVWSIPADSAGFADLVADFDIQDARDDVTLWVEGRDDEGQAKEDARRAALAEERRQAAEDRRAAMQAAWEQQAAAEREADARAKAEALAEAQAAADRVFARVNPAMARLEGRLDALPLGGTLRSFQREGVLRMVAQRRLILGDEMGTGKTVQATVALALADAYPAVIVAPKAVKSSWARHIHEWTPGRRVVVLDAGTKDTWKVRQADVVVLNSEILYKWVGALADMRPRALLIDEAHVMKAGRLSRRGKACQDLADTLDTSALRICMSGTPMLNRPDEVPPLLRILGVAGLVAGGDMKRWLDMSPALQHAWVAPWMLRRLKVDVLAELPDRLPPTILDVDLEASADGAAAIRDATAKVERHRELLEAGRMTSGARFEIQGAISTIRKETGLAKSRAVASWASEWLRENADRKLVIFAHHQDLQGDLVKRLAGWEPLSFVAAMSEAERDAAVAAFQTDDSRRVIVCSLRAAGIGITLTAAADVLLSEPDWTPGIVDQAVDRCHRIGQVADVQPWLAIAPDSIDTAVLRVLERKRALIDQVVDGADATHTDSAAAMDVARILIDNTTREN